MYAIRRLMQGSQLTPKAPLGNNARPVQPLHHRTVRTNINFNKQGMPVGFSQRFCLPLSPSSPIPTSVPPHTYHSFSNMMFIPPFMSIPRYPFTHLFCQWHKFQIAPYIKQEWIRSFILSILVTPSHPSQHSHYCSMSSYFIRLFFHPTL